MLKLDSHGTKCGLALGPTSEFSLRFTQDPTCYEAKETAPKALYAMLPTPSYTDAEFVVPAHAFDVTLESVDQPAYNAVTDADENGYFHRLRQRTKRVDLFDESGGDGPHELTWEYRPVEPPEPALHV